jgi:hypothetical protein
MSIFKQSLDAIYLSPIGVRGVIRPKNSTTEIVLRVIDKTDGYEVEAGDGAAEAPTIEPAACVRLYELEAKGISREALTRATITMNGASWTILSTLDKRTPHGKGELVLTLREA